jgi:TonB family protein
MTMQAAHSKITTDFYSRLLPALVAICAAWPLLLLAAEPVKLDAPDQQQQPPAQSELKRTKVVNASYPQLALDYGIEGFVDLHFTVLPDGSTADIEVVQAEPAGLFEASAIKALQQWRYEPGQPVAQPADVRIRFAPPNTAANALPLTYDDPMDPVSAASMESVLRRDLDTTLNSGVLSASSPIGIAIGIVRNGDRRAFTFGAATRDAIFEIGSIAKTFTGLLLALAIEQEAVKPDTPVRELLPQDTVAKPANGSEITLLDLVTQHSGLPRMPDNFQPKDPSNPYAEYAEYGSTQLYQFLRVHGVAKPAQPEFLYSNLGFALLGQALANRASTEYPALLKRSVLDPLGMRETAITLDAGQQPRVIQGHDADRQPVHAWDRTGAFIGAGVGLRSTVSDMLRYLEANLPQRTSDAAKTPDGRTFTAALARSQTLHADSEGTRKIAYAWTYDPAAETYRHNGVTSGYSSFAFFSPKRNHAGIVLVNLTRTPRGSLAVIVGDHIGARFAGEKAISLKGW